MEKLPPHDIDAEEAVIGSLLIDGTAIDQVTNILQADCFYSERTGWLYEACLALEQRNEAINQITLAQEMHRQGKLEACGGAAFLSHLVSIVPTSLDIEYYAQIVYRLSVMRRIITAADQIAAIGYQADPDVEGSLNRAENELFTLRRGQTPGGFVHIRQILDEYFEASFPGEEDLRKPLARVWTSFPCMDELLGGFAPSDLIIIAGRPSMGKTNLVLNIARNAAVEHGASVGVFSLEMARQPIGLRLLSSEASTDLSKIRLGLHDEDEERRVMAAIGSLSEAPIYIDDSPILRVPDLRSKTRRLFNEHGINLLIIDHMGLVDGQIKDRVQEMSYVSRSLKALARELNIPVIAVSQLSRAADFRASHVPQLSDLRDSGSIEQDADVVIFIYREAYYRARDEWEMQFPDKEYPEGLADIIIAKHRNGPTAKVKMRFTPKFARFENLASAAGVD